MKRHRTASRDLHEMLSEVSSVWADLAEKLGLTRRESIVSLSTCIESRVQRFEIVSFSLGSGGHEEVTQTK